MKSGTEDLLLSDANKLGTTAGNGDKIESELLLAVVDELPLMGFASDIVRGVLGAWNHNLSPVEDEKPPFNAVGKGELKEAPVGVAKVILKWSWPNIETDGVVAVVGVSLVLGRNEGKSIISLSTIMGLGRFLSTDIVVYM